MQLMKEIPDSFWSLFRSINRETYIEALLQINEEYQYNNYFLSWEVCIQVLSNYFTAQRIAVWQEDMESDAEALEPPATRVLRWLVKTGWLKRLEDFSEGVTNIVIPDYAAVFLETFEHLSGEPGEDTDVYIQNVYAILFSYRNDSRQDPRLLNTALVNTRELNRVLQTMLHNMDKFFVSLLDQDFYGDLLKEHLNGYVEEVVRKKYHILKTTDNFYQYKMDIKNWLKEIAEEENRRLLTLDAEAAAAEAEEQAVMISRKRRSIAAVLDRVSDIERGFRDIERRIFYMDREHTRYVRATVTRLNYLLNQDRDMKGLLVQLLNKLAESGDDNQMDDRIRRIASRMNFSQFSVLSDKSLYKRRKARAAFAEALEPDEAPEDLTREEVLRLNRIHNRYTRKQVEAFIEERMQDGVCRVDADTVCDGESFEKLILAYDNALRKDSRFQVLEPEKEGMSVENGRYRYPALTFVRRAPAGNRTAGEQQTEEIENDRIL